MAAVRGRNNRTTERRLRYALVRAGVSGWKLHPPDLQGRPDFYFPENSVAVFVDGCFWHGCPRCGHYPKHNQEFWRTKIARNKTRDRETTARLRELGVAVLRFWEHELCDDLPRCVHSVQNALHREALQ